MKITLELADIDYASVVKFALPLLQGKLAEGDSEASKMLAQIAKMPSGNFPSMCGRRTMPGMRPGRKMTTLWTK